MSFYFSGEDRTLIHTEVAKLKGNKDTWDSLLINENFSYAIRSLGGNARCIAWFLDYLSRNPPGTDVLRYLSLALDHVRTYIKSGYSTVQWENYLGGHLKGVRTMCLYSLARKPVRITKRLNGVTVDDVRKTGILQLIPAERYDVAKEGDKANTIRYYISLPLILLRALNDHTQDVEDSLLDPLRLRDSLQFEEDMLKLRLYRYQLIKGSSLKKHKFKDIYPHGFAPQRILDMEVPFSTRLELVRCKGKSSAHDSVHRYDITAVPICGASKPVDLTTVCTYMLLSAKKN